MTLFKNSTLIFDENDHILVDGLIQNFLNWRYFIVYHQYTVGTAFLIKIQHYIVMNRVRNLLLLKSTKYVWIYALKKYKYTLKVYTYYYFFYM